MSQSHHRNPDANHHKTPAVIGRPLSPVYTVLRRVPQLTGDPEHAVARGESTGDVVALFYRPEDAREYVQWKNQT